MRRVAMLCLVSLLVCVSTTAEEADPWKPSSSYNAAVPTVESVLGYQVGAQFTPYSELARYYRALAAASDRVRLESYGKTYENRELLLLTISSPENLARLDPIRAALAKLADPRKTTPAEAERLAAETPAVVWLGYNVHGDEANSAEAAMQVSYELAASQNPKLAEWLQNVVVLIDPLQNPDGHERYVQYYRSTMGAEPVADRFAAEQQQRWPRGRFNHYLFDLNRDWAWQTQIESQSRVRKYLEWIPQVFVDLHEMGYQSTYYFAPPADPQHELIKPWLSKWYRIYGEGNAAAFDRQGFRYFTHEVYDAFAPSYGDTWPSLQGAVGMTYEQAGGGTGLVIDLAEDQRRLTLKDRALRHFTASMATIDTTARHRAEKLKDFYAFRRGAIQAGQQGPLQHFYLVPGNDPQRMAELIRTLQRQGIEVQRATAPFKPEEATGFWGEKAADKSLPAGTYVIDLAQPAGFLARALLEREAKLDTNETYDLTGWALPYAMGIETWAGRAQNLSLAPVADAPDPKPAVQGPERAIAYVVDWEQSAAVRLLARLSGEGFKSYVSIKPFTSAGKMFPPGTLVIPAETNPPSLHQRIREVAARENCGVIALGSGFMESGPDFGSSLMRFVRRPRIAVLTGEPISPTQYGAIWHMFDQVLGLPFTPILAGSLRSADLTQYNVIIVPGDQGDGAAFERVLDGAQLRAWVTAGGVLIGIRGGAVWMTRQHSGLASTRYQLLNREADESRKKSEAQKRKQSADKLGAEDEEDEPKPSEAERAKLREQKLQRKLMSWEEREKYELSQQIPGTILRAKLDTSHPIGFGLREPFAVLNFTAPIIELTAAGENPIYYPKGTLKLSGYISPESETRLQHTAFAVRESLGRGHVILFADSPGFRGFWTSAGRLLTNAVFFGNITNPKLD